MTKRECIDEAFALLAAEGPISDRDIWMVLESIWNQGAAAGVAQTMKAVEGVMGKLPMTRQVLHSESEGREIMSTSKTYLGDGAFAEITPMGIVLTTSNGIEDTNRIVLEAEVWGALLGYVARARVAQPSSDASPVEPK